MVGFAIGLSITTALICTLILMGFIGKKYGQKLVDKKVISIDEFYDVGYIGWFFVMLFGK